MNGGFVEKCQVVCQSNEQEEMQETGRDLWCFGRSRLWASHRPCNEGLPVALAVSDNIRFEKR